MLRSMLTGVLRIKRCQLEAAGNSRSVSSPNSVHPLGRSAAQAGGSCSHQPSMRTRAHQESACTHAGPRTRVGKALASQYFSFPTAHYPVAALIGGVSRQGRHERRCASVCAEQEQRRSLWTLPGETPVDAPRKGAGAASRDAQNVSARDGAEQLEQEVVTTDLLNAPEAAGAASTPGRTRRRANGSVSARRRGYYGSAQRDSFGPVDSGYLSASESDGEDGTSGYATDADAVHARPAEDAFGTSGTTRRRVNASVGAQRRDYFTSEPVQSSGFGAADRMYFSEGDDGSGAPTPQPQHDGSFGAPDRMYFSQGESEGRIPLRRVARNFGASGTRSDNDSGDESDSGGLRVPFDDLAGAGRGGQAPMPLPSDGAAGAADRVLFHDVATGGLGSFTLAAGRVYFDSVANAASSADDSAASGDEGADSDADAAGVHDGSRGAADRVYFHDVRGGFGSFTRAAGRIYFDHLDSDDEGVPPAAEPAAVASRKSARVAPAGEPAASRGAQKVRASVARQQGSGSSGGMLVAWGGALGAQPAGPGVCAASFSSIPGADGAESGSDADALDVSADESVKERSGYAAPAVAASGSGGRAAGGANMGRSDGATSASAVITDTGPQAVITDKGTQAGVRGASQAHPPKRSEAVSVPLDTEGRIGVAGTVPARASGGGTRAFPSEQAEAKVPPLAVQAETLEGWLAGAQRAVDADAGSREVGRLLSAISLLPSRSVSNFMSHVLALLAPLLHAVAAAPDGQYEAMRAFSKLLARDPQLRKAALLSPEVLAGIDEALTVMAKDKAAWETGESITHCAQMQAQFRRHCPGFWRRVQEHAAKLGRKQGRAVLQIAKDLQRDIRAPSLGPLVQRALGGGGAETMLGGGDPGTRDQLRPGRSTLQRKSTQTRGGRR